MLLHSYVVSSSAAGGACVSPEYVRMELLMGQSSSLFLLSKLIVNGAFISLSPFLPPCSQTTWLARRAWRLALMAVYV